MKKKLLLLVSVLICFCFVQGQTDTKLTNDQKVSLSKANRNEKNGWTYIHIEGNPKERGFQYGYLLANEIDEALRDMNKIWEYNTATKWSWLIEKASGMFKPKIDSENMAEINGIVEGMKARNIQTTSNEIITYNGWLELLWYWWPSIKDSISLNTPTSIEESCSAFIATGSMTDDGQIVMAHNTWGEYNMPQSNIIIDIQPTTGNRILMQTAPGLIHSGTDFFITSAGIVGTETTIHGFLPFDPKGVPEFVRVRRAMQDASSIEEWCEIMKKGNNGGYANSWLIGDIKTNEIARLELGLKYIGFEKKKDGYFTGSNIVEDMNILRRETTIDEQNIKMPNVSRRIRWKQLMNENVGKINIEIGKTLISDHYDYYLNIINPDSRTICGHFELDNMAYNNFDPYFPHGAFDGKVVSSALAKNMTFIARWGSPCGIPFDANKFLIEHPQYDWMTGLLKDRPTQPWTTFKTGEKK